MEKFVLEISGGPNLKFVGEKIASTESSWKQARSDFSGETGRCEELTLYRTKGGSFVCYKASLTQWQGERDIYSGAVCKTEEEVCAFFGHGWLAKELYEEAGIEGTIEIE